MEQATQTFNWAILAIPALLILIPAGFFYAGCRLSAQERFSRAGKPLSWLGGQGITLVLASLLFVLRGAFVPDMVVTQLPLILTVCYFLLACAFRSSFILSIAIATPGLWLFCSQSWQAFSGAKEMLFKLPQDPFWYLLAAVLLFCLRNRPKLKEFWNGLEEVLTTMSGSYFMGGLWLLALGQQSLLAGIGLAPYVWAVVLLAAAAFLLWCARLMQDAILTGCSMVGLVAGLYTFVSRYPW